MAIKKESEKVGIVDKEKQPRKGKTLTSVMEKRVKKQEKDGEAGIDPQDEQLNTQPEPNTFPKEKIDKSKASGKQKWRSAMISFGSRD